MAIPIIHVLSLSSFSFLPSGPFLGQRGKCSDKNLPVPFITGSMLRLLAASDIAAFLRLQITARFSNSMRHCPLHKRGTLEPSGHY